MKVRVRIPAKLMLAGEYSVLFPKGKALSYTLDLYMSISLELTSSQDVVIESNLWQNPVVLSKQASITDYLDNPLMHCVFYGVELFQLQNLGFTLKIESDIEVKFGVGSSSALRLGVLYSLWLLKNELVKPMPSEWEDKVVCLTKAYEIQKSFQKRASGYDMLTQWYGGLIKSEPFNSTDSWNHQVEILDHSGYQEGLTDHVHVFVGGKGADTKLTMKDTLGVIEKTISLESFQGLSNDLVTRFTSFLSDPISSNHRVNLFSLVKKQRSIMMKAQEKEFLGLLESIENLNGCDDNWSFKTTGAGGEDALILIGSKEDIELPKTHLEKNGWYPLKAKPVFSPPPFEVIHE